MCIYAREDEIAKELFPKESSSHCLRKEYQIHKLGSCIIVGTHWIVLTN